MKGVPQFGIDGRLGMQAWRMAVADRLRASLAALGVNQARACRMTGLRPNALSQFLSGRPLSRAAAIRLRETFGISLDWVYMGDPRGLPARLAVALLRTGGEDVVEQVKRGLGIDGITFRDEAGAVAC